MAAAQLRNTIWYHLDNDLLDTANFLAGRLQALEPRSPDAAHLLALTYLRLRRYRAAYDSSLKYGANGKHLACAYVFAQACLHLARYLDGVQALEKARALWLGKSSWGRHTENTRRSQPDAAAVQTLLGKLWQGYGDPRRAGECFVEVQKTHPFTWEAFEGLCKINANINIMQMFQTVPESAAHGLQTGEIATHLPATAQPFGRNTQLSFSTPLHDPFGGAIQERSADFVIPPGKARVTRQHIPSNWDTPTTTNITVSDEDSMAVEEDRLPDAPQAPALRLPTEPDTTEQTSRSITLMQGLKRTVSGHVPLSTASNDPPSNPRRSNRIFGQGTTTRSNRSAATEAAISNGARNERDIRPARVATGAKGRIGTTVGRVVSGNRKVLPPDPADKEKEKLKRAPSRTNERSVMTQQTATITQKSQSVQPTIDQSVDSELLDSLKRLAIGAHAASRFDLPKAIQAYRSLPMNERESPWVLAQLGKAHYEASDYRAAEDYFARLMKIEPSRIEDIEVYSTVLWHLKEDTALAMLCHTVREHHYDAPQTWVVIGNSFSLAREHDQAIAAFRRATQLDPKFAYAWVLMGHEYIANEEYDSALYTFRKSIAADSRGYGGWYGLGRSLERMGKCEDAERHYRIAAEINPSNATLLVCIGVVLEKLRNRKAALLQYHRALQLNPTSALARFRKARVLMHLKQFASALEELEHLRDQAPDEANVWFLLGKCYKGLGDRGDALRAFTTALNLDAKASPFIREAMEALDDDDDDNDSDEDDTEEE